MAGLQLDCYEGGSGAGERGFMLMDSFFLYFTGDISDKSALPFISQTQ